VYALSQIEAGEGRYIGRRATVIQRDHGDAFETHPAESGWTCRPGWHVAGWMGTDGRVHWCDLWPVEARSA
jgi:hypothetical protein